MILLWAVNVAFRGKISTVMITEKTAVLINSDMNTLIHGTKSELIIELLWICSRQSFSGPLQFNSPCYY